MLDKKRLVANPMFYPDVILIADEVKSLRILLIFLLVFRLVLKIFFVKAHLFVHCRQSHYIEVAEGGVSNRAIHN